MAIKNRVNYTNLKSVKDRFFVVSHGFESCPLHYINLYIFLSLITVQEI